LAEPLLGESISNGTASDRTVSITDDINFLTIATTFYCHF
jgi:hypothetical protein